MRVIALLNLLSCCFRQDIFLHHGRREQSIQEPSVLDLRRARKAVPGPAYVASEPGQIATRLNTHLTKLAKNKTKACLSFTLGELLETLKTLWVHKSPKLSEHYALNDGRGYPHSDSIGFEASWKSLGDESAAMGA